MNQAADADRQAIEALPYGCPEQADRADAWLSANSDNLDDAEYRKLLLHDVWYIANRRRLANEGIM